MWLKAWGLDSATLGFKSFALYFAACVTLGKLLSFSEPWLPPVQNGDNSGSDLIELQIKGANAYECFSLCWHVVTGT